MIVGVIAAILPARRAARIDILRGDPLRVRAGAPASSGARPAGGIAGRCSGIISQHRPAALRRATIERLDDQQWHAFAPDVAEGVLETDGVDGLSQAEADARRTLFGPNALTPAKGQSRLTRFLLQFADPLVIILVVSAVVTIFLKEYVDAVVIFGVVFLNAVVGYIQEAKAVAAIDALSRAMTAEATVVRAGEQLRLPAPDLVPGDLVLVQAGDKVPADLRLLRRARPARGRVGAHRRVGAGGEGRRRRRGRRRARRPRRHGLCLHARHVRHAAPAWWSPRATRTEVGKISRLIKQAHDLKTPLTRKIDQFSKVLLVVIVVLAALTLVIGVLRGEPWSEMFNAAIALAVAAIPEGLPAAVTITLAIGVNRMAKRQAIIRKLPAVETLGSTMVICTDKTGTLTQNEMTVQRIVAGGEELRVSGVGYGPVGRDRARPRPRPARELLLAGLLCNDTALTDDDGHHEVAGDPTEAALLDERRQGGAGRRGRQGGAAARRRDPVRERVPVHGHRARRRRRQARASTSRAPSRRCSSGARRRWTRTARRSRWTPTRSTRRSTRWPPTACASSPSPAARSRTTTTT